MRPALAPRRAHVAAVIAGVVALAAPGSARAAFVADSTVDIKSIAPSYGTGSYTGTIAVDKTGTNSSTVRITLNNTTSNSYITSIGFSLPGALTSASLSTPGLNSAWRILGDSDYTNGSMFDTGVFGAFDIGAGIGSTWHTPAGSNPTNGIAAGQSGTFEFTLSGPGANVTADALMSYLSTGGAAGIGVRFRTANDKTIGGKVLAQVVQSPPPPPPPPPGVPAPPAVLLALAGAGCLLGRGALRRKPAPTA